MMRTAKFIHYIALAFLLCCTSNEAAIRYVDSEAGRDQTGRISNDCLDDSEPCQTLAHTLDQAVTDDAIFLIGEFDEQIEIEKSLTIVGKRSDALAGTFVDCSGDSCPQVRFASNPYTWLSRAPRLTIDSVRFVDSVSALDLQSGTVTIRDCEFANSQRGIVLFNDSTRVERSLFRNIVDAANNVGGAIVQSRGALTVIDSQFLENQAGQFGGAINTSDNAQSLMVSGSQFIDNRAEDGGAISAGSIKVLNVVDSTFDNNRAEDGSGGAVLSDALTTTIEGSLLENNQATVSGGAIATSSLTLTLNDNIFELNRVLGDAQVLVGGAVHWIGGANGSVENTQVVGNFVAGQGIQAQELFGGGFAAINFSGELLISESSFENLFQQQTGALDFSAENLFVSGNADSSLLIQRTTVHGRPGLSQSDGVIVDSTSSRIEQSTIAGHAGIGLRLTDTLDRSPTFEIERSTISANAVGLRLQGGTLSMLHSTLFNDLSYTATGGTSLVAFSTIAAPAGETAIAPVGPPPVDYSIFSGTCAFLDGLTAETGFLAFQGGPFAYDAPSCGDNPEDLALQTLTSNGGPTQTMAITVNSAAIDRTTDCELDASLQVDQRGVSRPQGLACDLGAFERTVTTDFMFSNGFE